MHLRILTHLIAIAIVTSHIRAVKLAATTMDEVSMDMSTTSTENPLDNEGTRQGIFDWISNIFTTTPRGTTTTSTTASDVDNPECGACKCGQANTYRRIVGGQETEVHEYPWMAMILRNGRFHCGASLINNWYVASAAHCLVYQRLTSIKVRFWLHDRGNTSGTIDRNSAQFLLHEDYDEDTYDNDIALIKLSQRVEFRDKLRPICLPQANDDFDGDTGIATGWGAISENGPSSNVLREVSVPILSQDECRNTTYGADKITDNMLCAGFKDGGKDACQGDSGGPFLVAINDTQDYQLAGIVSWGHGCARPNTPGVYTRVTRYLNWIDERTRDACTCSNDDNNNGNNSTSTTESSTTTTTDSSSSTTTDTSSTSSTSSGY